MTTTEYFVQYDVKNKDINLYAVTSDYDIVFVKYSTPKHILNSVLEYTQGRIKTLDKLVQNCYDIFTVTEAKVISNKENNLYKVTSVGELHTFVSNLMTQY